MTAAPAGLVAELDSGSSSVVNCWLVTSQDGVTTLCAVTEHDRDLTFGGVTYLAAGALSASASRAELGGALSTVDVEGAFAIGGLDASDLRAGLYDGATVKRFIVCWTDPSLHWLHSRYSIGEVTETSDGHTFEAPLEGLETALQGRKGRVVSPYCPLELGSAECGAVLTASNRRVTTTVSAVSEDGLVLRVASLGAVPVIGLRYGSLSVTSGAASGAKLDLASASGTSLLLFSPVPPRLAPGDTVVVTVGCDKVFSTCVDVFGRARFFQGFPDVPVVDSLVRRYSFGDE